MDEEELVRLVSGGYPSIGRRGKEGYITSEVVKSSGTKKVKVFDVMSGDTFAWVDSVYF